jgi:hypothetical protein
MPAMCPENWGPNWGPTCPFWAANFKVKRCRINGRCEISEPNGGRCDCEPRIRACRGETASIGIHMEAVVWKKRTGGE